MTSKLYEDDETSVEVVVSSDGDDREELCVKASLLGESITSGAMFICGLLGEEEVLFMASESGVSPRSMAAIRRLAKFFLLRLRPLGLDRLLLASCFSLSEL